MRNLTLVPFLLTLSACSFFMGEPKPEPESTAAAATASAAPTAAPTSEPVATASATTAAPVAAVPKPSKTFSLSEQGLSLSIDAPEDAKIEASKSKDGLGGATISAGATPTLRIMRADARLATIPAAKATLQKLAVSPAKSFSKEEKDLLVYDRGNDKHFLLLVKIAGVTYACQNLGGEETEAALEPGLAACRTLKKSP